MKINLELSESMLCLLAVLDEQGHAQKVLERLAAFAIDGVRRPGSWERQWLYQAFGDAWTELLERDPQAQWNDQPLKR